MLKRYSENGCPTAFPVRTKCIALFQKIHGVDTLLFAMYVYEYGHECPAPNKRRVYISYLDSAQYFTPKYYRTTAYHTILVEYLRYVKKRGFHTAHIWSCPPTPGDDYIFYCHPKHQLVPREDMLRAWYHKMLDSAKAQGVVIRTSTLYDDYFSEDSLDLLPGRRLLPTSLPYFEGDYIPGEIENIISYLDASRGKANASGNADEVMLRIGHYISKMKDNFIVVHLRNRSFAAAVERGDDVSNWKEDSDDDMVRNKRAKINGKDPSTFMHDFKAKKDLESSDAMKNESDVLDDSKGSESNAKDDLGSSEGSSRYGTRRRRSSLSKMNTRAKVKTEQLDAEDRKIASTKQDADGKNNANLKTDDTVKPTSCKGEWKEMKAAVSSHFDGLKRGSTPIGDTSDDDPPVESDMFESRQQFLNYCQTNHCQFDELRRAKHSSMMVLFQLHNPAAPRFLQQCGACYRDITHGIRFHCTTCSNFDLCQECYDPVTSGEWAKKDPRFSHDKTHKFESIDMEATEESKKSRDERLISLKAHIELLEHAATCSGAPTCTSLNCQRLKKKLSHVETCTVKPKKDCKVCTRILSLCAVHSRLCTSSTPCPIPFCDRLRERNMRLRQQQQLMDDRRRQAQNELYRAGAAES